MATIIEVGIMGVTISVILLGLAVLLSLLLAGTIYVRRQSVSYYRIINYLSVAVVTGVLLIAGLGVAVSYVETPEFAVLLGALVLLPLAIVGIYLQQTTQLQDIHILATSGYAWSVPFLVAIVSVFGASFVVGSTFGLPPEEFRELGLDWVAIVVAVKVVVFGSLLLGNRVSMMVPDSQ